ncbi:MAG: Gfo/Idh/MocA family protein [Planctomycetota bacterium]|jgi:predicted dehydrogenase
MSRITRRQLVVASLGGAAATAVGVNSLAKAAAASEQIQVALIGVRGMGHGHIRRLEQRRDVRVAALCDVDQQVLTRAKEAVKNTSGKGPALVEDFRRVLDNRSIDAVIIATPHHWHCPIAIRALQAEKDVYLEKPGSHVFREGRLLAEAARKCDRIVQHGTQMRSSEVTAKASEVLASGILGNVKMAKAWNCQRHTHRPTVPDGPTPSHVNYDMWLGPAPKRPFNPNRFHGNWNWYRDYGNGDIGGDGIHDLDMARWGLGVTTHPTRITAHGSRVDLKGEREFPDNMMVAYHYPEGKVLLYEDRGWTPYGPHGFDSGNAFYGTEGMMVFSRRGFFQVYLGREREEGPGMRGDTGHPQHLYSFFDSVRSRRQPIASADVAHLSCALIHLGEIAYRVGRVVNFDAETETIVGDEEASRLLTKQYRSPWNVLEKI